MSSETVIKETVTIKVVETVKGRPRVLESARVVLAPVYDEDKGTNVLKTGITRKEWELNFKDLFGDYDKFYADYSLPLTAKTRSFDLSEPMNKINAALLRNHPWVAKSKEDINQHTLFLMYDEIEEAKKENKSFEYEMKAYTYLYAMSQVDKSRMLTLFGVKRTENVSPEVIAKRLMDIVKNDPKHFVEVCEDKAKDIKIMIEEYLSNQIVSRHGGIYYVGTQSADGIPMGSSIEQVVEFIRNPKNSELVAQLMKKLESKKSKE